MAPLTRGAELRENTYPTLAGYISLDVPYQP